jgi:hypothetical protein
LTCCCCCLASIAGVHLIDMGSGPVATLTIRQMDDEGEQEREEQDEARRRRRAHEHSAKARLRRGFSFSQRQQQQVGAADWEQQEEARARDRRRARVTTSSCRGILGRLLVGVRRKLLENFYCRGVTAFAADIADGPFSLLVHVVSLVNNFSMNTTGHLENWQVRLEGEVNDLAVSKHINHANELLEVRPLTI